jgi:predicted ribosome quality control (RQC) complex YloA/Tae2 family protein
MQPFDALTMKAVLEEAKPLILNRRVEKVYQLARDEVIIALRSKAGTGHLLLSAQASFGRLCLVNVANLPKHMNPPAFCQLLRKHLGGGTLIAAEQVPGERVVDLIFDCVDELGTHSQKALTAEIMGRHSNLIFWDTKTKTILGASHHVTAEMSRQREVAAGLKYVRPPQQEKPSIFTLAEDVFEKHWQTLIDTGVSQPQPDGASTPPTAIEQWLISTFSGLGRHLADEIVTAAGISSQISVDNLNSENKSRLWEKIAKLKELGQYKPAMKQDLTRYTVISWWPELGEPEAEKDWKSFHSVNDMVDEYFKTLHRREQMQQLKDRVRSEWKGEQDRLLSRLSQASKLLAEEGELEKLKQAGDMILANIGSISPGQTTLECDNLYLGTGEAGAADKLTIVLNPNLNPAQNAQNYYRQFAKGRVRQKAALSTKSDASARLEVVKKQMQDLDQSSDLDELNRLKEMIVDRGRQKEHKAQPSSASGFKPAGDKHKGPRLASIKSTDGWIIYLGRNKQENDILITKLAQPHDIWLHVQGQEGAHVLIKNPNRQDPPASTLKEAAQVAARFSRVSLGS